MPEIPTGMGRIAARECGSERATHYQMQRKDDAGWFVVGEYTSIADARAAVASRNEPFVTRIVRVVSVVTREVTW